MKELTFSLFSASAVLVAALVSEPVWGQTLPDAGSLLRQQEERDRKLPAVLPPAAPGEAVRPAVKDQPVVRVLVKAVRFAGGAALASEPELQELVRPAIGAELDLAGLQELADRVSRHLQDKGYLLARAYLPGQDVTEGVIEIAILEGRLDGSGEDSGWRITAAPDSRLDRDRLRAIGEAQVGSGQVVRGQTLERALLLMNDQPGVIARARLEPGTAPGSTRLDVDVQDGPLVSGSLSVDTYGSAGVGREQVNLIANLNAPLGGGDRASVLATVSEGVQVARLLYDFPLGLDGLRGNAGYTDVRYQAIEGVGAAAGLEGNSQVTAAGLSYPFLRSRELNLSGNLGLARKALRDESRVGTVRDKRVDALSIGGSGERLDQWLGGGLSAISLGLVAGRLDLSRAPADEAFDAASLRTQGGYAKINYTATRLQRLGEGWTLLGALSGQWAGKNLDSSEKFILGGPSGVRAYPTGEASGDEGWLANLELRYDVVLDGLDWALLGNVQLSAFVDMGGIGLQESPAIRIATATGNNRYALYGAGVGLGLAKAGSHSVRLMWAHKIGSNPGRSVEGKDADGDSASHRLWLQATLQF